jgi:putative oxidoreductase
MRFLNQLQPWTLCLLRITLGIALTVAGFDKLIPAGGLHRAHPFAGFDQYNHFIATLGLPFWIGSISLVTEFLGGLMLIAGLLTRFAAFMIAADTLLFLILIDLHRGYAGFQYPLALFVMALLLVTTGSGALALDRRLGI